SKEPFDPSRPLTWLVDGTDEQNARIRHRLIAALNVNDNDLTAAAHFQICLLGRQNTLLTDLPTLTALYRLTRIPQLAKVSVSEYLLLLRMMYGPDLPCVDRPSGQKRLTIEDIAAQFDTIAWSRASGFTAPHLQYIMTGAAVPDFDIGYDPQQIAPFVNSLATLAEPARLTYSSFVFEDLNASMSTELFKALLGARIISNRGIILAGVIDFATIAALLPVTEAFAADVIGELDSKIAYNGLVAHQILLPLLVPTSGALSEAFNEETDLSWLFKGDQNGQYKRTQVRTI